MYDQESVLTLRVREWLATQGDVSYYKASDRYQKGVSDIIMNVRGVFVLAELKARNGVESPHQRLFLREMLGPGGVGGFCYSLKDVKDLVQAARLVSKNY